MNALRLRFFILCVFCIPFSLQAQTISIPFQYSQSLIYVKVKVNNKSNLTFLMDTGANTSVLDKKVADALRLPVVSNDTVTGTAGKEPVQLIRINTMQAGKAIVRNLRISKRSLNNFSTQNSQRIDGILGTDFLKKFAITIDYRKKKLIFFTKAQKPGKQMFMTFEMEGDIPKFEAKINDTFSTYLRYNSGVSMSRSKDIYINVSPDQWNYLKGLDHTLSPIKYFTGTGVGGDVYLQVVSIKTIAFDGMTVISPFIIVQPREGYFEEEKAIGFFGNNLLEKYNKVTIDFLSKRIIFNTIRKSNTVSG